MILGRLVGQELFHGSDCLASLRPAMGKGPAHNLRFFLVPASTDPEEEAPARIII